MGYIEDLLAGRIKEDNEPGVATIVERRMVRESLRPDGLPNSFAEQIESLEGFLPDSEPMELKAEGLLRLLHSIRPPYELNPKGVYG